MNKCISSVFHSTDHFLKMQTLVFGFVLMTIIVFVQAAPIEQTNQSNAKSMIDRINIVYRVDFNSIEAQRSADTKLQSIEIKL